MDGVGDTWIKGKKAESMTAIRHGIKSVGS